MVRTGAALAGLAVLLLAGGGDARAQDAEKCDLAQRNEPVSIVVLPSKTRVHAYAATIRDAPVVRRDATTVVFADGRVITSNVAAASNQINALGWGSRRIEMVASAARRRARRPSG